MKIAAVLVASLSVASAFAPVAQPKSSTAMNALFDDITGMDLWTPKKDQNTYGARTKKNIKTGQIGSNSYVPSGLSAAEYAKVRARDDKKKTENYAKNVQKAFKFEDFTQFYLKRGTNEGGSWLKSPTLGHRMAKTKYDYSGKKIEDNKLPEAFRFGKNSK